MYICIVSFFLSFSGLKTQLLVNISQTASSQRTYVNNKKDNVLYITTLESHKHNKRRAESIKSRAQMEERQEE